MSRNRQAGFTLVELMVVMVVAGLIAASFFHFFAVNLSEFLHLQVDAATSANQATQEQRIANVVRGTTGIISATSNDLQIYSYFSPSDAYVSLVHYYLNSSQNTMYADITPMTSNPPIGTPITAQKKTYMVASGFYLPPGGSVFNYIDASDTILTQPITDLNAIKMIQVNLAVRNSTGGYQTLALQVELRNRKTNL